MSIELYKRAFKTDTLQIMRFSDLPPNPAFSIPKEYKSRVVQATLKFGDNLIRLSDRGPQQPLNTTESERVTIVAEMSAEQVKHAFDTLGEQGHVTMPLEKTFYSPLAGDVVDKFGVVKALVDGGYTGEKFIKKSRGHKKALIAIVRMMLTCIYHMLSKGEMFAPTDYIILCRRSFSKTSAKNG